MSTIRGMLNKVKKLDLPRQTIVIIQNHATELTQLNKNQLFSDSMDSAGLLLQSYSSPQYAINKNSRNPLPGLFHPDLYDTGAFYRGFYAQVVGGQTILFGSTDSKSSDLESKYGKEIFGLTKDNKKVYALGIFYTDLKKYITLTTGLRFS